MRLADDLSWVLVSGKHGMSEASKRGAFNPRKYTTLKGDRNRSLIPVLIKYSPLFSILKFVRIGYDKGPRSRFC